jgi:hypothetical protein
MSRAYAPRPRALEVGCVVEIEESASSLHAHVELEGVDVAPGDSVLVHDAPVRAGAGGRLVCRRRATVMRATRLGRAWTRLAGLFELGELYEVGFTSRRSR